MNQLRQRLAGVSPYCYLIPCFAVFGMFLFYPFFKTIYLSLFLTDKLGKAKIFVGLKNYTDLLTSESFYNSILVTLIFVVIVVFGSMLLGLATAVLCSKTFPGIRAFSTAYALPMAIASSGAAMIFKVILNPTIGVFNKLTGLDINWISDPRYALICVAVLTAWLNSGINFLYFSAGLGNIDESIYERASVDGASGVQKFFRLTLPGLSPIIFYTLVVNIIQAFQSFGQVKILTQGGPGQRGCPVRHFVPHHHGADPGYVQGGKEGSQVLNGYACESKGPSERRAAPGPVYRRAAGGPAPPHERCRPAPPPH